MLVTIDMDEGDRKALDYLIAVCDCWRNCRYAILVALLAGSASSIGYLVHSIFLGGAGRQLAEAAFAAPISIALLWLLRKRWKGPIWTTLAAKMTGAIGDNAVPQH